ncbi:MAG: hypothetical protein ACREQV_16015, partial [Candidatus Binatia bacterium]
THQTLGSGPVSVRVDGTMTDEALEATIQMELERSKLKKEVPVSQVADWTLLLQAQRELGLSK